MIPVHGPDGFLAHSFHFMTQQFQHLFIWQRKIGKVNLRHQQKQRHEYNKFKARPLDYALQYRWCWKKSQGNVWTHIADHSWDHVFGHNLIHCRQGSTNLQHIVAVHIALDLIHQHKSELVLWREAQRSWNVKKVNTIWVRAGLIPTIQTQCSHLRDNQRAFVI